MAKETEKKEEATAAAPAAKPADKPKKGTLSRNTAWGDKVLPAGSPVPEGFMDWIKKTGRDAKNYLVQE